MSPQTIIFIGRSGCGKSTQAKLLTEYLEKIDQNKRKIYHVETGEKFRDFIKGENLTSRLSKQVYDNVERQPDFLAITMWTRAFIDNLTGDEHLIIDGAPRSLPEAYILNGALNFYNRRANIIYLNVRREWSEKMLAARGREDDSTKAKIEKRLNWFDTDVVPAIGYFKEENKHNVVEVKGERPQEEVLADIIAGLKIF
ncbi:MAG TPA: nucleoside monophosphate kinase [Candidatus Nanoarchaeia archaeon]|nr:nucleoside monophosphate kinase [Candidatus Nanoarchaeia archaeon]